MKKLIILLLTLALAASFEKFPAIKRRIIALGSSSTHKAQFLNQLCDHEVFKANSIAPQVEKCKLVGTSTTYSVINLPDLEIRGLQGLDDVKRAQMDALNRFIQDLSAPGCLNLYLYIFPGTKKASDIAHSEPIRLVTHNSVRTFRYERIILLKTNEVKTLSLEKLLDNFFERDGGSIDNARGLLTRNKVLAVDPYGGIESVAREIHEALPYIETEEEENDENLIKPYLEKAFDFGQATMNSDL